MTAFLARAALALLAAGAGAQDLERPLTWNDCVAIAAAKNPELISSALGVETSRASYYGSYNGIFPQLNLTNSYSRSSTGSREWQAQASASLSLFDAGQFANIRAASAQLSQAEASLQAASATLRFELRRAFAQLLFVQQNVEVSRAILALRDKSAQLVTLRYNSGRESLGNMLRSKAQLLQAQSDLAQSFRQVRTAQRALLRRLGRDEFSAVTATGTLAAADLPDFPADSRQLAASRPDVALQLASVAQARANLSQARSGFLPNLSAGYARTRSGPAEFPSSRYGWSVSGQVSYPLFAGGPTAVLLEARSKKKALEASEQDLRAIRDQAALEVEEAWTGYAAAVDQERVRRALLEAARQRNAEADVRYASGLLNYDNWEIIASDRINSERQGVQARLESINAQTAWERAIGKKLERE